MSLSTRYNQLAREAFGDDTIVSPDRTSVDSGAHVARGDTLLDDVEGVKLKSELLDVPDERWTQFVRCMITQPVDAVSKSNAVGMFEMMPRRLADLGVVKKLARSNNKGKTIWVAEFIPPLTSEIFLTNPKVQYRMFAKSMRNYADRMASGEIARDPSMSLSGALAILHRAGPKGLQTWANGERFEATQRAFDRVSGIF